MEQADPASLSEAFWTVARQLRHRSVAALAPLDVTPAQARALMLVGRHGSLRLSTLSEHLHVAARSTTEFIDALEGRGLVCRVPDPSDRRATLVELTDEGRGVWEQMQAGRSTESASYFDRLGERDRKALARILRTLAAEEDGPVGGSAPWRHAR